VQVGHETTYGAMGNHHFFTKTCHRQTCQNYQGPLQSQYINALYVLALEWSLIIFVGHTMTWYREKIMISYSGTPGLMPNSHKKS
jgi:hypothetical protein